MVDNLRLLFKDIDTVNVDRFGSLRDWIHEANDADYWNQLVHRLLHPGAWTTATMAGTTRLQRTMPLRKQ